MAGGRQPEFEILPPERNRISGAFGGRGQPSLLTPELLDWMCRARAEGMSIKRACKALEIDQKTHSNWMKRGREDNEAGKSSIYVEYFRRIPAAEELGTFSRREFVRKKIEEGKPEDIAQAKAMLAYEIALESQRMGRLQYELKKQALKMGVPALPPGETQASAVDFSLLSREEFAEYEALATRARTDFASVSPAEVARLQALVRKARGQDTQDEEKGT